MILEEAILKVAQLDPYQNIQLVNFLDKYVSPSGQVWVTSVRMRSIATCRICQLGIARGSVTVQHIDGRKIEFPPMFYHYVEAGHPRINWHWPMDKLPALGPPKQSPQSVSASFEQDLLDIMEDA